MKLFKTALVCSLVSSAAVAFIPLAEISKGWESFAHIAVPLIFWAGLAAEQILFRMCRKKIAEEDGGDKRSDLKKRTVGEMMKNKAFSAACISFAVLLAVFVIMAASHTGVKVLQYIILSLIVLSLRCVFIFGGRCFRYLIGI